MSPPGPAGSGLSGVCGDGRTGSRTGISSDSAHVFAVDTEGARRSAENRTTSVTGPPRDASRCAPGRWRAYGLRVVLAAGIWKNGKDAAGQPAPPSDSPRPASDGPVSSLLAVFSAPVFRAAL